MDDKLRWSADYIKSLTEVPKVSAGSRTRCGLTRLPKWKTDAEKGAGEGPGKWPNWKGKGVSVNEALD